VEFGLDGKLRRRFAEPHYRLDAVSVDGETVFVYMGDPGVVEVLDRATGAPRGTPHLLGASGASVPAVADGLLYLLAPQVGLLTIDADGRIPWQVGPVLR